MAPTALKTDSPASGQDLGKKLGFESFEYDEAIG
jgi:hypothetical protein